MNLKPNPGTICLALLFLTTIISCRKNNTSLDQLEWLSGKWEGTMNGSIIFEQWSRAGDKIFNGFGGTITDNDTIFSEDINIEIINDTIFYVAKLASNTSPVSFKLLRMGNNKVVFENPQHDFPQRIIYMLNSDSSLTASIEGKDHESHIDYHYKKVKQAQK